MFQALEAVSKRCPSCFRPGKSMGRRCPPYFQPGKSMGKHCPSSFRPGKSMGKHCPPCFQPGKSMGKVARCGSAPGTRWAAVARAIQGLENGGQHCGARFRSWNGWEGAAACDFGSGIGAPRRPTWLWPPQRRRHVSRGDSERCSQHIVGLVFRDSRVGVPRIAPARTEARKPETGTGCFSQSRRRKISDLDSEN